MKRDTRLVRERRRGWMLVELLITLTLIAIAGGTAVFLIARMLRTSQVQADALVQDRTLHEWEDQFRQDSRSAKTARVLTGATPSIQFQQGETRVTYLSVTAGIERRVNDQLAGRWQTRGEWQYTLDESAGIVRAELHRSYELSSSEQLTKGQKELPRHRLLRVEAAIGRTP